MIRQISIFLLLFLCTFAATSQVFDSNNVYPKIKEIPYDHLKKYVVFQGIVDTTEDFTRHLLIVNKQSDTYTEGPIALSFYIQDHTPDGKLRGASYQLDFVPKKKSNLQGLYKPTQKFDFEKIISAYSIPTFAVQDVKDLAQLLDGVFSSEYKDTFLKYLYLLDPLGPFERAKFDTYRKDEVVNAILFPGSTVPLYGTIKKEGYIFEGALSSKEARYGRKTYDNGAIEEGVFRNNILIYEMPFNEPPYSEFKAPSETYITKVINNDTIRGYDFNPDPNRELLIGLYGEMYIGDVSGEDIQFVSPKNLETFGKPTENNTYPLVNIIGKLKVGKFENQKIVEGVTSQMLYKDVKDLTIRYKNNDLVNRALASQRFKYYLPFVWYGKAAHLGSFKDGKFDGCGYVYVFSHDEPTTYGNYKNGKYIGIYYDFESIRYAPADGVAPYNSKIESDYDVFIAHFREGALPCFPDNELELEALWARFKKWKDIRKKNTASYRATEQRRLGKIEDKKRIEQSSYYESCKTCDGSGLWEWNHENETSQFIYKSSALIKCGECHGTGKIKKLDDAKYNRLKKGE